MYIGIGVLAALIFVIIVIKQGPKIREAREAAEEATEEVTTFKVAPSWYGTLEPGKQYVFHLYGGNALHYRLGSGAVWFQPINRDGYPMNKPFLARTDGAKLITAWGLRYAPDTVRVWTEQDSPTEFYISSREGPGY